MQLALQLTTLAALLVSGAGLIEASRRHVVCVRLDRQLRSQADAERQQRS